MNNNSQRNFFLSTVIFCSVYALFSSMYKIVVMSDYNSFFGLFTSVYIAFYVCYGYKIPHGNLLKYCFLLYAIAGVLRIFSVSATNVTTFHWSIRIMLVSYMAGRLHKIKQNRAIGAIVLIDIVYIIYYRYIQSSNDFMFIEHTCGIAQWLAIYLSYLFRYKEHKAAGLADSSDAKKLTHEELEKVAN